MSDRRVFVWLSKGGVLLLDAEVILAGLAAAAAAMPTGREIQARAAAAIDALFPEQLAPAAPAHTPLRPPEAFTPPAWEGRPLPRVSWPRALDPSTPATEPAAPRARCECASCQLLDDIGTLGVKH